MMMKKLEEMQSHGGVGMSNKQIDLDGKKLEDKYGLDQEIDIYAKDDEDDVNKEGSSFLNVYKEGEQNPDDDAETAVSSEIQFKRSED